MTNNKIWNNKVNEIISKKSSSKILYLNNIPITNHFVQINQDGFIVEKLEKQETHSKLETPFDSLIIKIDGKDIVNTITPNRLIVKPRSGKITVGRTNCFGFGVKEEILKQIYNSLSDPIKIPTLEMQRYAFEQKPDEKGLIANRIIPIKNATNIMMIFPRSFRDCTVFQNICYKNVQLFVDKLIVPHYRFATTFDGRFVQYQLMSHELDATEATPEYLESLSRPLNNVNNIDRDQLFLEDRYISCPYDNTNFNINFQLERGNIGYTFDGLDSKNDMIKVEFRGESLCDDSENDTYLSEYIFDKDSKDNDELIENIANPEMWVFQYAYWTWSIEGVEYIRDVPPEEYNISSNSVVFGEQKYLQASF